jgi:hypothetical protein
MALRIRLRVSSPPTSFTPTRLPRRQALGGPAQVIDDLYPVCRAPGLIDLSLSELSRSDLVPWPNTYIAACRENVVKVQRAGKVIRRTEIIRVKPCTEALTGEGSFQSLRGNRLRCGVVA